MSNNAYLDAVDQFIEENRGHLDASRLASLINMREAISGLFSKGETANTITHSLLGLMAAMAIKTAPPKAEVELRTDLCSCFFDYMTACMSVEVCEDCGYPHPDTDPCEDFDNTDGGNRQGSSVSVAYTKH